MSDDDSAAKGDGCEARGSSTMDVAVISGATFAQKAVTYYEVDGIALVEGDIALGRVADVKKRTADARDAVAKGLAFGVGRTGDQFRWPGRVIPYTIDPALPNPARVTQAIAHWEAKTPFRFPLRTAANQGQYPDWVEFFDGGGCWSALGRQGGMQQISLGPGCSVGNAIHEIGHTVGLWHEQSREDRDLFVVIHWQNIQSGMAAQFNQHITDGDDLGPYDYGSIMHYPRTAFSANGGDTITPIDPNAQIGQRTGLSAGDIEAVRQLYALSMDVRVHLENIGDRTYRQNEFAGTRGQSRRLEGFQIDLTSGVPGLGLSYMAHLADIGDVPWVSDGQFVGTRGQSRRLEGFAIKLTGANAAKYTVEYMAHLQDLADTAICRDGEFCGTRGQSRRVEGIMVRVIEK